MDFIDPSSDDALDDAEMVADMLVAVAEQGGTNKHWNEEALAFLTGLVMHVKTTWFNLDLLKTGTMTLYVVLPARRLTRYARLVRLVVGTALQRISATVPVQTVLPEVGPS